MDPLRLVRVVRTYSSEVYVMWDEKQRVGQLDLHFAADVIYANIVLEKDLSKADRTELLAQLDDEIISSYLPRFDRLELAVTIYSGRQVDSFTYDGNENQDDFEFDEEF